LAPGGQIELRHLGKEALAVAHQHVLHRIIQRITGATRETGSISAT
jgi:hypothetical protein